MKRTRREMMFRPVFFRTLFVLAALLAAAGGGLGAQETFLEPARAPEDNAASRAEKAISGELTYENYNLKGTGFKQNGVRAAQVADRKDLAGGPWATGRVGDFVLENEKIRVIVQGGNRSEGENDRAFALYEKMGFEHVGDVDNVTGDGRHVIERKMFLSLKEGAQPSSREFKPPI